MTTQPSQSPCQRGLLGDLLPIKYGKSLPEKLRDSTGNHPVFGSSGRVGVHSSPLTTGPTLVIGRKGNVGAVHYSNVPCWPIDTAYYVEAPDGHNLRYYKYLLESLNLARLDRSTAIPGLSRDDYNAVEVCIARPEHQDRIVAEIEKQFSRLDEAVAGLKRVKANLKRYKAAVLKAAVEGRLVPTEADLAHREGRSYETGAQLLQRILETRRSQWQGKGKYKEPAAPDTTDLPELPEGWVWATVEQLTRLIEYGSSAKTSEEPTGVPVLRMGNIVEGKLVLEDLKYLPDSHSEFPKLLLESGDLLFNRTNSPELVGKTAVFQGVPKKCSFASYLIRVRPADGCLPVYLAAYINSMHGRAWVKTVVTQQVGQANVNGTKLQALCVPLPSLAEQQRIIAELDRCFTVVSEVTASVGGDMVRSDHLRQTVLHGAFNTVNSGESDELN